MDNAIAFVTYNEGMSSADGFAAASTGFRDKMGKINHNDNRLGARELVILPAVT